MASERGTVLRVIALALLAALLAAPAVAEEQTPPALLAQAQATPAGPNPPKTESATPPAAEVKPPHWYDDLSLNAFVSAGYLYNFNDPSTRLNSFRFFDAEHNTFSLSVAELSVQKAVAAAGDVGFRADFDLGGVIPPRTVAAGDSPGQFDVRQAFVSYIAPVGNGLRFDVGKFVTLVGYEVIEGWDNYDDNYSRSYLFNYAIPFTHLGTKVSYSFSPLISVTGMVANGWDADLARTRAKMFGGQIALTPLEPLSVLATYLGSWEPGTTGGQQYRQLFDVVATFKLASWATVGANFDYGTQEGASVVAPGEKATWWGGAGYLRLESPAGIGIAFRGEYMKDDDGFRLGAPLELYEGTVTPYYKISSHFMIRAEGRIDSSPTDVFTTSTGGARGYQPTVALNALYAY
jgi:Putative beta-barrel porin-2, OmpL-like. bbp2